MSKLFSAEMAARKSERRRRPEGLLWPDMSNSDPFSGLPDDLPPVHSRFPIEPSSGYGDLSFVPRVGQNGDPENGNDPMTSRETRAWRLAMRRALGNLVAVQIDQGRRRG
ncbi:MAG TPA: hypothetical protein VI670_23675 [Thermoanaerobaculia bacterium]